MHFEGGVIDLETTVFERQKEGILENLDELQAMVEKVDSMLASIDVYMDVLQPNGASGKVRLAISKTANGPAPYLRSIYKTKAGGGWYSKRIKRGWASRSLKRSGIYEKNFEVVKMLCTTAETLIAERANLMTRLRSLSSGLRESTKGAKVRIDKIEHEYVTPFNEAFAPGLADQTENAS